MNVLHGQLASALALAWVAIDHPKCRCTHPEAAEGDAGTGRAGDHPGYGCLRPDSSAPRAGSPGGPKCTAPRGRGSCRAARRPAPATWTPVEGPSGREPPSAGLSPSQDEHLSGIPPTGCTGEVSASAVLIPTSGLALEKTLRCELVAKRVRASMNPQALPSTLVTLNRTRSFSELKCVGQREVCWRGSPHH